MRNSKLENCIWGAGFWGRGSPAMICKSQRSGSSNAQGMNGQDAQALEEGGIAGGGTQRQVRGRTGWRTTQCRWQWRGGHEAAAEGEPEVTGYTILQPELQEQQGGPRSPGSAPFQTRWPWGR